MNSQFSYPNTKRTSCENWVASAVTIHNAQWTKTSCHKLCYQLGNCVALCSVENLGKYVVNIVSIACFTEELEPSKGQLYILACFSNIVLAQCFPVSVALMGAWRNKYMQTS